MLLLLMSMAVQISDLGPQSNFRSVANLPQDSPQAVFVATTREKHWEPLTRIVLGQWEMQGVDPKCGVATPFEITEIEALEIIEIAPIRLDDQGSVSSGTAVVRAVASWCGNRRRINTLVEYQNGVSRAANTVAGETMADPILQNDITRMVVPMIAPSLMAAGATCRDSFPNGAGRLTDTRVTGRSDDRNPPTAWQERWTWTSCGRATHVDVAMTALDNGRTEFEVSGITAP